MPGRSSSTSPIVAAEARGATITDVDGNTFVDFVGGVGVANVGHNHPRVVEAIAEQSERFLHTDFTVVAYEGYITLAERLGALVPITGETRGAFFNAGAEAVENAVKLARLYTGRHGVIAFDGAFHGRTLLALTMTSRTHPYKKASAHSRPRSTERRSRTPTAVLMPRPRSPRSSGCSRRTSRLITSLRSSSSHSRARAASFPHHRVRRGLRRICDEHGIVLVADEVQTGFGRTGGCSRWSTSTSRPICSSSPSPLPAGCLSRA